MNDTPPDQDESNPSNVSAPAQAQSEPPIFTLLSGLATVACLFTPRITIMLPVMAAVGCGVAAYSPPTGPMLVKYGKRQFLEPMFQHGEMRVANAGLYNDANLLSAVRDDETSRTFFIPTWRERMENKAYLDFQGHRLEFNDDDIVLPLMFDDYFLFSLCEHIHYRMPTDFEADAAIVIHDPIRFKQRLISTFLASNPDYEPIEGSVVYYDPYRDYSKFKVPEMAKHFGYAYQKEARIVFRPKRKPLAPLRPVFLSIGPMAGYADMLML